MTVEGFSGRTACIPRITCHFSPVPVLPRPPGNDAATRALVGKAPASALALLPDTNHMNFIDLPCWLPVQLTRCPRGSLSPSPLPFPSLSFPLPLLALSW